MAAFRRRVAAAAVAAVALVAAQMSSCGGDGSPSSSTPTTTLAPSPPPTPGGLPDPFNHASCPLGKGDVNAECRRADTEALADMEAAMDALLQQRPQVFDLNDEYSPGTRAYKVLDKEAYMNGLVANLRVAGLCAERDPDDALQQTIRARNAAEFSEDFDVILSSGHMRRGTGMYRQTCTPSIFPVDRSTDAPPIGSGCGRPYPPPVSRFNCKINLKNKEYYTLDSTPLVGPDPGYCASVGFEGQAICAIRPHGTPDREACENWRVGKAKDTGRPGPTWTKADGTFCTGPDSGCQNHPDNQYGLLTYKGGSYTVSGDTGSSCTVTY